MLFSLSSLRNLRLEALRHDHEVLCLLIVQKNLFVHFVGTAADILVDRQLAVVKVGLRAVQLKEGVSHVGRRCRAI